MSISPRLCWRLEYVEFPTAEWIIGSFGPHCDGPHYIAKLLQYIYILKSYFLSTFGAPQFGPLVKYNSFTQVVMCAYMWHEDFSFKKSWRFKLNLTESKYPVRSPGVSNLSLAFYKVESSHLQVRSIWVHLFQTLYAVTLNQKEAISQRKRTFRKHLCF